ncbi:hypothetical protein CK203_007239 [Vitis vinifera]|uniref:Uncharacterized protein n=1 Tax=Vitis vinifera TaxID=29760 RepID=A0A438G155_VITVI|nr:hypothetical protein CK203_007239 [Vitis vinifera]
MSVEALEKLIFGMTDVAPMVALPVFKENFMIVQLIGGSIAVVIHSRNAWIPPFISSLGFLVDPNAQGAPRRKVVLEPEAQGASKARALVK